MTLIPIIRGERKARNEIFIENHEERAVLSSEWKYIRNYFERTEELYNIREDPMEVINLASEKSDLTQKMKDKLLKWVRKELGDQTDPMWLQMAKWNDEWIRRFGRDPAGLKPKPTLIKGINY